MDMADAEGLIEAAGNRFTSVELIGRGSFGDVYKAERSLSAVLYDKLKLTSGC
ncbi:hypothetical protein K2173_010848 [Erythroxylum novogranatense]|uniref:Protein kinase domain-containing protein n=1 Tax=Erythroxylum novogranatense TaxID=1862640 RepID=A0AAV8T013_9ROSI|nr:hypothetical protein K2173_010848 [Erythroxylum novogranatense]